MLNAGSLDANENVCDRVTRAHTAYHAPHSSIRSPSDVAERRLDRLEGGADGLPVSHGETSSPQFSHRNTVC